MSDSNGNIHQISQRKLSRTNNNSIHALIAAYFNLMSKLNGITAFSHHVDEVSCKKRKRFSLRNKKDSFSIWNTYNRKKYCY